MPTKRKQPDPAILEDILLSIKFPRCSVCELDWFLDEEGTVSLDEKCKRLLPMPPCKCTTVMISQALDFNLDDLPKEVEYLGKYFVEKYCIPEKVKRVNRKGMCRLCLDTFIRTSDDVIEHDYMSETQPNHKFSVGGRCVICQLRFTPRSIGNVNRTTDDMSDFFSCVRHTVEWIGNRKRLLRRIKQQGYSAESLREYPSILCWLDETDGNESDECFSEDECMEVVMDSKPKHRRNGAIAPEDGEIKRQLIERDPLFRQECEDFEYIQKMSKTKEGRLELGIESDENDDEGLRQLKRDEEMARKLQRLERRVAGPRASSNITRFLEIIPPHSKVASSHGKQDSVPNVHKISDSGIKKFLMPSSSERHNILSESDESYCDAAKGIERKHNESTMKYRAGQTVISLLQDSSDDELEKEHSSQNKVIFTNTTQKSEYTPSSHGPDITLLNDSSEDEDKEIHSTPVNDQCQEADVNIMKEMGFTSDEAKKALRMANYNRILAMNILLDKNMESE